MKADYRKLNDKSQCSSTYHKKDGTNLRAKLKESMNNEIMKTTKVQAFVPTIIEYRDKNGKLCEGYFDETLPYIQKAVLNWVDNGCTQFKVIENNRNYDFYWLSDYE